jgi:hypothetical protein
MVLGPMTRIRSSPMGWRAFVILDPPLASLRFSRAPRTRALTSKSRLQRPSAQRDICSSQAPDECARESGGR